MQDYLENSARTAAGKFHADIVPLDLLLHAIRKRLETNINVDGCKKSLFYGKDLSYRLEDLKQQAFDGDTFQYTVDTYAIHAILGLDTEAAELMEHLQDALIFGTQVDRGQVINEAGDMLWYLAMLFRYLDVTFEEVAELNLQKLARRYPEKFTEALAMGRDELNEEAIFRQCYQ